MSTKTAAKERAILLKKLREAHKDSVANTQALLKEQKAIRRQICQPMRDGPKTIPEIATLTGVPADQILWHVTAMRKYGLVIENGLCGEYYLYQMAEDKKK
jgi:predicted transcriptional regulator